MNVKKILKYFGMVLALEAALMLLPLFISLYYRGTDTHCFVKTVILLSAISIPLILIRDKNENFYAKDGFAVVALSWILISIFGSLPYYFSGYFDNYIDCFFETVSGFTTTGASVLNGVEHIPKGLLFWRNFTTWIGGMGILVFTLAVLPKTAGKAVHIMRAESPGPVPEKLVPRLGDSSKILYIIYLVMTAITIFLYMICGIPFFDATVHGLTSAGTGGFSILNNSIAGYNNPVLEIAVAISIVSFGINFSIYYMLIKKNFDSIKKDEELKLYLGIIFISTLLISLNLFLQTKESLGSIIRHAFFQVSSIITTTGFSTTDFNLWPTFSKTILFLLMFIGGSASSTAGAIKCIRVLIIFKMIKGAILKIIHPRAVNNLKIAGKTIPDEVSKSVLVFFCAYMSLYVVALLLISIDGLSLETNLSAVASCLGNIGPGLGDVGPASNYSVYSTFSTFILSVCMLLGRLEIFPLLLLIMPAFWKRVNI